MHKKEVSPVLFAVLAAACYGISAPCSKLLLETIQATWMAALLYLGAGIGMLVLRLANGRRRGASKEASMSRQELPFVIAMIALDIAAPILLMFGLKLTAPANASLLNNFEIVATSLIALVIFKEAVGARMWIAIALITAASALLSAEDMAGLSFSSGSLLVLAACVCWGFENNCTRKLSLKSPLEIVIVKGLGSGIGAAIIALCVGDRLPSAIPALLALSLGFFAYGLSIYFYILAQRGLGAARTSAYYAVAPFIGVALSFALFGQPVSILFWVALAVMMLGAYFAAVERHSHAHTHEAVTHEHRHHHHDGHHTHPHGDSIEEHSHVHVHEPATHTHRHTPDAHHTHAHRHLF